MRKPLSIVLISLLFLLSPIAIIVLNAALNMVPLFGYGSILYRLPLYDLIILALYPLCALSIWMVRKWGWWVLILSASLMMLYNFAALFLNPFASAFTVLLMNGALFSVALFFFRRHLIAPYFHPHLRWWEQDQRYQVDIYLKFTGMDRNGLISDISSGGCYVFGDVPIETGEEVPLQIICGSFHLALIGRVMRVVKESDRYCGFGLMFVRSGPVQKRGLEHLIQSLKEIFIEENEEETDDRRANRRYLVANDMALEEGGASLSVKLLDISRSGCSLSINRDLASEAKCRLHFFLGDKEPCSVGCSVVWKREVDSTFIYGLHFSFQSQEEKKSIGKLIKSIKKIGANRRDIPRGDFYRQCEEDAGDTPYRIIEKLKGIIRKTISS